MNLCTGDKVKFQLPKFKGGSFFRGKSSGAKFIGYQEYIGIIEKDSYGSKTGQHTFTILLESGDKKLVKGRNLYPNILSYEPGINHDTMAQDKNWRKMNK